MVFSEKEEITANQTVTLKLQIDKVRFPPALCYQHVHPPLRASSVHGTLDSGRTTG